MANAYTVLYSTGTTPDTYAVGFCYFSNLEEAALWMLRHGHSVRRARVVRGEVEFDYQGKEDLLAEFERLSIDWENRERFEFARLKAKYEPQPVEASGLSDAIRKARGGDVPTPRRGYA